MVCLDNAINNSDIMQLREVLMATTVSTTQLTPAETQFLNECKASSAITSTTTQIAALNARILQLQTEKTKATIELQTVMTKVLSSKNSPVTVPPKAIIVRQLINNVDSLIVQTA